MAAMTENTLTIATIPQGADLWTKSLYNADVSGCEDLVAASTGKYHYVSRLILCSQSVENVTFSIGSGETTSAVTTIHLGPIPMSDYGNWFELDFGLNRAMKCTVSLALTIDSSAACPVWIYIEGATA